MGISRVDSSARVRDWRHHVVFGEPRLDAGAVSLRLEEQKLLVQRRNRRGHRRVVDGEPAVGPLRDRLLLQQDVELHQLRAAVRLCRAEAQRAEDSRDVRRIDSVQLALRNHLLLDQPLGQVDSRHVGLGLFQPAVRRANRLVDRDLPAVDLRVGGAEAVRDLMQNHAGQIALAAHVLGLLRRQHLARDGQDHVVHARVHEVLEEDLLRSLLRVDARIVGQIVRHGLVAVVQIARAQRRIDHLHRRRLALLRGPVLRGIGSACCIAASCLR